MPRAKRGFKARQRRKRELKLARGNYGARSKVYRVAVEQLHNSWADAYRHRRERKREYRRLWIARINAAARLSGISYSKLIAALKRSNIELDRKVLADLAYSEPEAFKAVVHAASKA